MSNATRNLHPGLPKRLAGHQLVECDFGTPAQGSRDETRRKPADPSGADTKVGRRAAIERTRLGEAKVNREYPPSVARRRKSGISETTPVCRTPKFCGCLTTWAYLRGIPGCKSWMQKGSFLEIWGDAQVSLAPR